MAVILLTNRRELGMPMYVVGHKVEMVASMTNARRFTRTDAQEFVANHASDYAYRDFLMTIDGD